jgi:hypothetical protein
MHRLPILALAIIATIALLFTGCGTADKTRLESQLATAQQRAEQLRQFVAVAAPQLEQFAAIAAQTGDPKAAKAAADMAAAVTTAKSALAEVDGVITATRSALAQVEADADGKVPWWSVLGLVAVKYGPRVLGAALAGVPYVGPALNAIAALLANADWNASATRKQKDEDAATLAAAKLAAGNHA